MPTRALTEPDFETLAHFRHQLRRFLHASEELTQAHGCTPAQYQLLLQLLLLVLLLVAKLPQLKKQKANTMSSLKTLVLKK